MTTDDADEAAVQWFVRLQDCEEEQLWEAHLAWLQADPAHAAAYARVESLWVAADDLPHAAAPAAQSEGAAVLSLAEARAKRDRSRRWALPFLSMAAAVAVLAGPQITRMIAPPGETYRTGGEETKVVTLADGSRLTLNRNSAVTVRLEDDRRTATLATGEVLFDVHHEPARPFTVTAAGRDVRVLGTEFDVLDDGSSFAVAVRRGLVSVSPAVEGGAVTKLPAGRALSRGPGARVDTVERIDPYQALAWERGQLVFTDKPIEAVARTLSRYMGAPIAVDPALRGMKVSAVFLVADRSQLRRQIEAALPIRVKAIHGRLSFVPAR
ncbi:FecR family protein [Sphingomonas sp. Leaf257]|jgi:transmembrane sensor|uniref:FecR family protein n=1 Tax=Sphingomonas sp. Leaf257 TaxID=1736309 RepID=UPI0006F6683A|nr:FecR domain-containing protein [Sphingomonas sp. Leaf257]KQO49618.1 hypothetical protein ASF14_14020 [Sphingomonas sp. Leaf257]